MTQAAEIITQFGIVSAGVQPADTLDRSEGGGTSPARAVGAHLLPASIAHDRARPLGREGAGVRARATPPTPARDMQSPLTETKIGMFGGYRASRGKGNNGQQGSGE